MIQQQFLVIFAFLLLGNQIITRAFTGLTSNDAENIDNNKISTREAEHFTSNDHISGNIIIGASKPMQNKTSQNENKENSNDSTSNVQETTIIRNEFETDAPVTEQIGINENVSNKNEEYTNNTNDTSSRINENNTKTEVPETSININESTLSGSTVVQDNVNTTEVEKNSNSQETSRINDNEVQNKTRHEITSEKIRVAKEISTVTTKPDDESNPNVKKFSDFNVYAVGETPTFEENGLHENQLKTIMQKVVNSIFSKKLCFLALIFVQTTKHSTTTLPINTETYSETTKFTTVKPIKTRKTIIQEIHRNTRDVKIENHPYMVSILKEMIHFCCGTIISSSWVLTAAHCLVQRGHRLHFEDLTLLTIIAGQSRLGYGYMQMRRVMDAFLHVDYVKKMFLNDIGMINLYEPFEFNEYVNVVNLPYNIPYKFFNSCAVVSWTVYHKDLLRFDKLSAEHKKTRKFAAPQLQWIDLPTITETECSDRIKVKEFITRKQICTEYGTYKNVSCSAEMGSPLICGDKQYGIFSWGIGCDDYDYPGVFTRVAPFQNWIGLMQTDPQDYISTRSMGRSLQLEISVLTLSRIAISIMNL